MTVSRSDGGLLHVVVGGSPYERGLQYGKATAHLVERSLFHYVEVFKQRAGLDWKAAKEIARSYEAPIRAFLPDGLEEMRGIAEGAGIGLDDVLALNARSEIMFAGAQRHGLVTGSSMECTSFAVLPEASASGHIIVGQNWDWLPFASETVLLLECHRQDEPSYATVVEAGLLAKVGFNEAGLGVCTNTLVSTKDDARPGVPYHVMLRALLDQETISAAVRLVSTAPRAFSANYLIAHADGFAVDLETMPGGPQAMTAALPTAGRIAHTNHFVYADLSRFDARVAHHPNSLFRLDMIQREMANAGHLMSVEGMQRILKDHRNRPDGICSHPDPAIPAYERRATISSVIADLVTGELWVANGPPCSNHYVQYNYIQTLKAGFNPVAA